jgi:hypothetical protein
MAPDLFFAGKAIPAQDQSTPDAAARSFKPARWLARLLLIGCAAGLIAASHAPAQERKPALTLIVSSQLWLKPGSQNPVEVKVVPSGAIPPQSVIVIRGVPSSMRFSEGRLFGPGVWVIPVTRLTDLKLQTLPDASSGGMLTVVLTSLEGAPLAEAQITVISMPANQTVENTTAPAIMPLPVPVITPPPAFTGTTQDSFSPPQVMVESRAELLMLLEKGKENHSLGNILIARQFYQRAADKGLAEGAFALAGTYDPHELSRRKEMAGVSPDPELAKKWYQKAGELGSPEAAARLSLLRKP